MLDWLIIAGIVILLAVLILAYLDMADVVVDLLSALLQLGVAAVALTISLLAMLLYAVRRLLKKQHNAIIP
jgi:hypothetical protein